MLVGGVVVGLAAGIGFGLGAQAMGDQVTNEARTHVQFDPTVDLLGRGFDITSVCAYAGGGAIALVGAILIGVASRSSPSRTIGIAPRALPHRTALEVSF
jgi:hypothetical protein